MSPRVRSCCGARTTCSAGSPRASWMCGSTGPSRSLRPPTRIVTWRIARRRARCCSFRNDEGPKTKDQGHRRSFGLSSLVFGLLWLVRLDDDIHECLFIAAQVIVALVEGAKQLDAGVDWVEYATAVTLSPEAVGRVAQPLGQ